METHLTRKNIPSLTGIRGVAALWVVLFHVERMANLAGYAVTIPGLPIIRAGWAGVDLFFMLSGFMLMNAHGDQFTHLKRKVIIDFAASRFFRVYPLSVVVLSLIAALVAVTPAFRTNYAGLETGNLSVPAFVATLALATRWLPFVGDWNEPTWSLSAEIVGYAAFPVLALIANQVRSAFISAALAASSALLFLVALAIGHRLGFNIVHNPGALARMGCFFMSGIFLRQAAPIIARLRTSTVSTAAILAVITVLVLCYSGQYSGLLPLSFGVLIILMCCDTGPVSVTLGSNLSIFLGRISFPLYLLHVMPLLAFFDAAHAQHWGMSSVLAGAALLVISMIALSAVLHRYVEAPCHKFARGRLRKSSDQLPRRSDSSVPA